jgi:hypothetical protein
MKTPKRASSPPPTIRKPAAPRQPANPGDLSAIQASENENPKSPPGRQRTGKVARLPRKIRNSICDLIQDGWSYPSILANLGREVAHLTPQNLSEWRKGGFQDWLANQRWTEQMSLLRDDAADLVTECDSLRIHRSAIQLAVLQIFQSLKREDFKNDPQNYTRALNALSRLSREALVLAKYQELDRPDCYDADYAEDEEDREFQRSNLKFAADILRSTMEKWQAIKQPSAPKPAKPLDNPVPENLAPSLSPQQDSGASPSVQADAPAPTTQEPLGNEGQAAHDLTTPGDPIADPGAPAIGQSNNPTIQPTGGPGMWPDRNLEV